VIDTMLHNSPDLLIHRARSRLFGGHGLGASKCGVSWCSSSTVTRARRGVPVHCPAGTTSLPDTLRVAGSCMTSLRRRDAVSMKSVRDITSISCFVTTMKILHALQICSTVFVKKCLRLHCSRIQLCVLGR